MESLAVIGKKHKMQNTDTWKRHHYHLSFGTTKRPQLNSSLSSLQTWRQKGEKREEEREEERGRGRKGSERKRMRKEDEDEEQIRGTGSRRRLSSDNIRATGVDQVINHDRWGALGRDSSPNWAAPQQRPMHNTFRLCVQLSTLGCTYADFIIHIVLRYKLYGPQWTTEQWARCCEVPA